MKLTVVIPTKNEEANIGTCLDAFAPFRGAVEVIVVDNFSPDRTREIADKKGANVLLKGPERCAQRNRGWREATGDYVMFVDADMIVPETTTREILDACASQGSGKDSASPFCGVSVTRTSSNGQSGQYLRKSFRNGASTSR